MTDGAAPGTSGRKAGTGGWRIEWTPLAAVAFVSVLIAVLNATSALMEAQADGVAIDPRGPWVYELTSIVFVILLAPGVGGVVRRFPPGDGRWLMFAAGHVGGSTVYALVHITGMVALRVWLFSVVGERYVFEDDNGGLVLPAIYEWRKDALSYAAIAMWYWGYGFWLAHRAAEAVTTPQPAAADPRIELRDGSRVILIAPADIAWIEAAGNYVQIHAGGATHLLRGTLAAFAERLATKGFVRVHRSRLVNRARVKAWKPTASGDLEITLDDGRTITGSRRYRAGVEG